MPAVSPPSLRLAVLGVLIAACAPPEPRPVEPIDLTGDATPFVEAFNAASGRPRLVVILPPT